MPYHNKQEAVEALRPGWKITGDQPNMVEVPNPNAGLAGQAPKIQEQQGSVVSIYDPANPSAPPDTLIIKEVGNAPWKGGVGYDVAQGPTKAVPAGTGGKPSDPSKWTPVYRVPGDVSSGQVGMWDPVNNDFRPVAAAPDAKPHGPPYDPVVITNADGTQRQVGMVDSGDQHFIPLAAAPDAKPSGSYDNQYVTNADGTKRLVGMVDTGDKHFIPVSADPTTQKRTIQTPDAIYSVDDNDNVKKLVDVNKNVPLQAVVIDGTVFSFDPNEKDPTKRLTQVSQQNLPQTIKQGDTTYVLKKNEDGTFEYQLPPGVKQQGALNTNTTAKTLDWYDAEGNLIKSQPNQNYVDPKLSQQPQLQAPNTTAPMIMVADPDHPGQTKWIKNEGRVTASQALQQLASQLSGHVVDGNISVDEAKSIIDGANTAMTAQTTAAGDVLANTRGNAQTGAGLLQQRVQAATGTLQSILGNALQNKNITSVPGDVGANLVQGLQGWTADLMGGQGTLDSASRMVQMADPKSDMADPTTQAAIGTLRQMLDKHAELTGMPHPAVAATQAAAQAAGASVQNGGMVAPNPYNPADIQWNQPPNPANVPGRVMGPGGVITGGVPATQAVAPVAPVAPVAQVPGQNYGAAMAYTNGIYPWNAQPGPAFIAPPMAPGLVTS